MNKFLLFACMSLLFMTSCDTVDVYEKHESIPDRSWDQQYSPSFTFQIEDTTSYYNLYFVLRHTDAYEYNNIWVNVQWKDEQDSLRKELLDIQLASGDRWLGTGMDDLYETRRKITARPVRFQKPGPQTFTLSHLMRKNPLPHVFNVGLRVEKVQY